MAKISAFPSQDIISGYKGTLDYAVCRGISYCRSWPRSPGRKRSASVEAQWPVFADATSLWNSLDDFVQDAYRTMASGSTLSGRDMMVKMYINAHSILPY